METRSASEIENTTEQLLEDLKTVVHDGEELLKAGAEDLSNKGKEARERLAAALEMAKETKQKLEERTIAGAKAADRMVRANPYQAIGIAFGVGLLFGFLANRK
jgi:ElaB/YqjD/DUF883 family membrane-anchored ribosome-binding protein